MNLPANIQDNMPLRDWAASGPAYENWYILVNHPARRLAAWIRASLLITTTGHRECRTWFILADADAPERTAILTCRMPLDAFRVDAGMGVLKFGEKFQLWPNQFTGEVEDAGRKATFHLAFTPMQRSITSVDGALLRLATRKSSHRSPNTAVRMTGHVTLDGERVELVDAWGHQGHSGGVRMLDGWTWGRAAGFEQDPDAWFEGVSTVRSGKLQGSFHLRAGGHEFHLNRMGHITGFLGKRTVATSQLGQWQLEGHDGGRVLKVNTNAMALQPVKVRYTDTEGKPRFNCMFPWASTAVSITPSLDGKTPSTTLLSKGRANVEWVAREPLQGNAEEYRPTA